MLDLIDVPYCDAFPDARAGWLDKLKEDMKAPDALGYHPPPAHLMRPISPLGQNKQSVVPPSSSSSTAETPTGSGDAE